MAADQQYEELRRMVAELTRRVYDLEQIVAAKNRRMGGQSPDRLQPPPAPAWEQLSARTDEARGLEARIGGHWLNRAGILAVLIGVSYFLKYAFDNEWIGPAARVLVGFVAGLAVVFWSEHVRRSGYAVFSYSLKAIGLGVLYLSVWASSQVYALIPNPLAFSAMTAVTAATVAMALWQNAEVIAAFAAAGAFITPVALSTGANNAAGLFGYLFILDVGALVLVRYRPWIRILIGAYIGTLILYSSWHAAFYAPDQFSVALVAISAVFAVFAAAPFAAPRAISTPGLAVLALLNAAAYFFEVWELFAHQREPGQAAIAAAGLAWLYFGMGWALRRNGAVLVREVHWAISAAFVIAALPIGLNAPWITIGWFAEGAALVRIGRRRDAFYLEQLGALALALGAIRVFTVDGFDVERLLFNERTLTFAAGVAALAFAAQTLAGSDRKYDRWLLGAAVILINVFALAAFTEEITDAWRRQIEAANAGAYSSLAIVRDFAYSALWMTYGAALMAVGFWKKSRFLRWQALVLIGFTTAKVFFYDTSSLDRGYRILSFIALGLVLLVTSFLYQRSYRLKDAGWRE